MAPKPQARQRESVPVQPRPPAAQGRSSDANRNQMIQDQARLRFYNAWQAEHGTLRGAQAAFQVKLDRIARERNPHVAAALVRELTHPAAAIPRLQPDSPRKIYYRPSPATGSVAPVARPAREATLGDSFSRGVYGLEAIPGLIDYGKQQMLSAALGPKVGEKLSKLERVLSPQ